MNITFGNITFGAKVPANSAQATVIKYKTPDDVERGGLRHTPIDYPLHQIELELSWNPDLDFQRALNLRLKHGRNNYLLARVLSGIFHAGAHMNLAQSGNETSALTRFLRGKIAFPLVSGAINLARKVNPHFDAQPFELGGYRIQSDKGDILAQLNYLELLFELGRPGPKAEKKLLASGQKLESPHPDWVEAATWAFILENRKADIRTSAASNPPHAERDEAIYTEMTTSVSEKLTLFEKLLPADALAYAKTEADTWLAAFKAKQPPSEG